MKDKVRGGSASGEQLVTREHVLPVPAARALVTRDSMLPRRTLHKEGQRVANAWKDKKTHLLGEDTPRRGLAYGEQPGTREHARRQAGSTQHGDQRLANSWIHENTHVLEKGHSMVRVSPW